jgi:hypothetical protein
MHASARYLSIGATLAGAAAGLPWAAAPPARAGPLAPPPLQTPLESTPPRELGPRFDHDAVLTLAPRAIASYDLGARLDPVAHLVTAKGTIRWTNATSVPADELWLHLYLNAFKNDRTLFLRSPFGGSRGGGRTREWGWIDVKRLAARELGGGDLWPARDRHTPGDPADETDIRVPLPGRVEPGATLTLDVEFESKLPDVVARTGHGDGFHMVAQWFPKLARHKADGTWVHFPFHPQSEFYADYGSYSVTIDVPENVVVGATGPRVEETVTGGRRIVRHAIDGVHDFAWAAWDRFRQRDEVIDGVAVRVLHPPGHALNADRTLAALRFALPRFSRAFGRYPYPVLTVIHPPAGAEEAGGMEYPTLITTGGPWWISRIARAVEAVTVHELGHQWFYGLVATDEHRWPFLDEGVNTWAKMEALDAGWGPGSLVDCLGLRIADRHLRRAFAVEYGHDEVVALPAADFASFRSLGALVYGRTGTLLDTLGNVWGRPALERAIGRYTRANRWQSPGPKHLVAAIREVVGDEAADQLEAGLFERGWINYVVRSVESKPVADPSGVFDRDGRRETLEPRERPASDAFVGRVLVYRHGTLRFPVEIELVADDGSRVRHRWDGRGSWIAIPFEGRAPLVSATVDPERRVALDENLLDNSRRAAPAGAPRVLERALWAAEVALAAFGP